MPRKVSLNLREANVGAALQSNDCDVRPWRSGFSELNVTVFVDRRK
jgi:hypothetical protein